MNVNTKTPGTLSFLSLRALRAFVVNKIMHLRRNYA